MELVFESNWTTLAKKSEKTFSQSVKLYGESWKAHIYLSRSVSEELENGII